MIKHARIFSLCFLLAACATPEQLEQARLEREQQDFETCRGYGLRPGSEAFGNCRLQLDLARDARNNAVYYGGFGYGYPHRGTSLNYITR